MPSTPTVAIAFTIAGSAYCGRTGSALVNSVAISWMSLLAIATAWYGRELWAFSMLVIPLVWSAWEWTIDLDVLEALVARDAETHDAVRMAFLMLGVAHATITWRGTRQQNVWIGAAGAIGAGLGTPLNAAVLCWRLNAATPALLPVLNACLPFFVGWLIAYKIGTDSPAESVLVRLEGAEKLGGELEAARAENSMLIDQVTRLCLFVERSTGVDPIAVEDIQRIVDQLRHKGIGVLITDHNVQETLHITDRAYLLFEGEILKEGTAEELASDETVRRVYLGQNFTLRPRLAP